MELEKHFKALSDITRLRILNLLLQGDLCGCDLQNVLGVSQSNISRHLTYLKNSGLALDHRVGFRIFYRLAVSNQPARKLLFEYLRNAFRHQPLLTEDIKRLKEGIEDGACTFRGWRSYSVP